MFGEYETIETEIMGREELNEFLIWFDSNIGTDCEVNRLDEMSATVTCFEVDNEDIQKINEYLH